MDLIDNIFIVDDAFPEWFQTHLENKASVIPWEFRENQVSANRKEATLAYMSYQDGFNFSDRLNIAGLVHDAMSVGLVPNNVPGAQIKGFFGLRWNGVMKWHEPNIHRDHTDDSQWTIVYFVNHSDGDLKFYEDDQTTEILTCKYKRGRAVVFPSNIYHGAQAPTTTNLRITMAVQYYMSRTN